MDKKHTHWIAAAIALLVVAYFGFTSLRGGSAATPRAVTLTGEYICLPHADPGEFETQECTFGLLADDGKYYALDLGPVPDAPPISLGARITASGTLTPVEMLSTDRWKAYPITGIMQATGSLSVEKAGLEGEWVWLRTELPNGKTVDAPAGGRFVMKIDGAGSMTSATDCNQVGGAYTTQGSILEFGPIYSTKMLCRGSLDQEYARELGLAASYAIEGRELRIGLRDGGAMVFEAR